MRTNVKEARIAMRYQAEITQNVRTITYPVNSRKKMAFVLLTNTIRLSILIYYKIITKNPMFTFYFDRQMNTTFKCHIARWTQIRDLWSQALPLYH